MNCPTCNGKGKVKQRVVDTERSRATQIAGRTIVAQHRIVWKNDQVTCSQCKGKGEVPDN